MFGITLGSTKPSRGSALRGEGSVGFYGRHGLGAVGHACGGLKSMTSVP